MIVGLLGIVRFGGFQLRSRGLGGLCGRLLRICRSEFSFLFWRDGILMVFSMMYFWKQPQKIIFDFPNQTNINVCTKSSLS
jgi:hypothetical protein